MEQFDGQLRALVDRSLDLATGVVGTATRFSKVFLVVGILFAGVTMLNPPLGFGWRSVFNVVLGVAAFAPAALLWWFSRNAGEVVESIAGWPNRLADIASEGIAEISGVVENMRGNASDRMSLVGGLWNLRSLLGSVKELAGVGAPVMAALSPQALGATALGAIGGFFVSAVTLVLVAIRLIA